MPDSYSSSQGNGIGGHQSHRMGTDVWLTPRFILDALGEFDLDPCSAPNPEIWPTAKRYYTLPTDGLTLPWFGRVWLNPPYGQLGWAWMEKLATHGTGTALTFARTETAGFIKTVWKSATGIMFLHGRLFFHHEDGARARSNSGGPSCLVAYGEEDAKILANSKLNGTYLGLK